jgi:hypothetical protein
MERLEDPTPEQLRELAEAARTRGETTLTVEVDESDHRGLSTLERFGFRPAARVLSADLDVLERDLERSPRGASYGSCTCRPTTCPPSSGPSAASSRSSPANRRAR